MTDAANTGGETAVIRAAVEDLSRSAATELDLELVEVEVKGQRNRRVVRVVVDGEDGVDVDAIASLSRTVSTGLDEDEELIPGAYTLEVTSPGVDRPLTSPRHWRRNLGRQVHVVWTKGSGDNVQTKDVTGKLHEAEDDHVVVNVKGRMVSIDLAAVERAKVVLPW